jgi:hypothetical protein
MSTLHFFLPVNLLQGSACYIQSLDTPFLRMYEYYLTHPCIGPYAYCEQGGKEFSPENRINYSQFL